MKLLVTMLKELFAKLKSCTCNKSSTSDVNAFKESAKTAEKDSKS
ncbi:MAG: hypothetical protein ACREBJ_08510 [Nitrosotalea sp.]